MDVKELRIGNYLTLSKKQRNELWYNEISDKKDFFKVKTVWDCNELTLELDDEDVDFEIEYVNPILLTEEWLFNFNCQKIKEGHFWWGRFELIFKPNYGYWYITSDCNSGKNYFSKVEFVHEWQNLVFAMDGTQLKLKS